MTEEKTRAMEPHVVSIPGDNIKPTVVIPTDSRIVRRRLLTHLHLMDLNIEDQDWCYLESSWPEMRALIEFMIVNFPGK
jgi:hypothetical protein